MNCPKCKQPMIEGKASIDARWWSWFIFGASYLSLFFDPSVGGQRKEVLKPFNNCASYFCTGCGMMLLDSKKQVDVW